jgi:hypothetical protein
MNCSDSNHAAGGAVTPTSRLVDAQAILAELAPAYAAWRRAIGEQTADGYPSGRADGPRGSGISDPTFAAVGARDQIAAMIAEVEATIVEVHGGLVRIDRAMKKHAPSRPDHDQEMRRALRCSVEWCDDLAVRGIRDGSVPFCWPHYREMLDARQEAG